MDTAGERIKHLRERRKLSQTQLATKAGISRNHLWRIEKGDRPKVGADVLTRIASALGVSVADLLEDQAGDRSASAADERAELAPEVEDLAERVNELPADLRARVVGLVDQALDLMQEQIEGLILTETQREILAYFDALNEENQELALAQLREILGEEPGRFDERRDALGNA